MVPNRAYNAHILSPTLFTMLVVMVLVTTITVLVVNWLKVGKAASHERDLAILTTVWLLACSGNEYPS
jgi:hypothetical protein